MSDEAEERAAVEAADASRREVAALRLLLREVAATNATGIDYALRCQRERDEARAEVVELRALLDAMSAARAPASADELDAARMDAAAARADLAAETATRTALRTQESQISGILADAGVPVGDLVQGVAALVRERDTARAGLAAAQRELHRLSCGDAIESDGLCPEGIRAEGHRAWARLWHREARRLWREVQDLSGMLTSVRAGALREAAHIARAHGGISAYYAIAKLAAEVEP